jgi:hypothetical protein
MLKNSAWLLLAANLFLNVSLQPSQAAQVNAAAAEGPDKSMQAAVASPLVTPIDGQSNQPSSSSSSKAQAQPGQSVRQPAHTQKTDFDTATPASEPSGQTPKPAVEKPSAPSPLQMAVDAYREGGASSSFSEVLKQAQQLITSQPAGQPAAATIKSNPALLQIGARAIDAGAGKVWLFNRITDCHQALVEWQENKSTITYTGKRHKIKHVHVTLSRHAAWLDYPDNILLAQAHLSGSLAILVGSDHGASLWIKTFRLINGRFAQTQTQLDSIPAFLTSNMSGSVGFRGADLLLSVAPVVKDSTLGQTQRLPEAESCTYRFWLHLTADGYQLMRRLPDEDQFLTVKSFLACLSGNRTEQAKELLVDEKLLSIPKYVGIKGANAGFKVAQMASCHGGAVRYRVITGGKDDLIFEVVRLKDRTAIRAIFVAPSDPFLSEIGSELPGYEQVGRSAEAPGA